MTLFECKFTDDLLELYLQQDYNKFCETWQKKSQRGMPLLSYIEGSTDDRDAADKVANYFSSSDLELNSANVECNNNSNELHDDSVECGNGNLL
jgi:hypothetical protein